MKLILERIANREKYCIGNLYKEEEVERPEGKGRRFLCNTLEPWDAGFSCNLPVREIEERKQQMHGPAAIPTTNHEKLSPEECAAQCKKGYYPLLITKSPRFGQWLPLVVGVPGYKGIRIHGGNTPADTQGCILPGWNRRVGTVEESRKALHIIMQLMQHAFEHQERVDLIIKRCYSF